MSTANLGIFLETKKHTLQNSQHMFVCSFAIQWNIIIRHCSDFALFLSIAQILGVQFCCQQRIHDERYYRCNEWQNIIIFHVTKIYLLRTKTSEK